MATLKTVSGDKVPNSYIVKLKPDVQKDDHFSQIDGLLEQVTHHDWHPEVFHGYAGVFNEALLQLILASPHVDSVEENALREDFDSDFHPKDVTVTQ